jgi:hypothetical protein
MNCESPAELYQGSFSDLLPPLVCSLKNAGIYVFSDWKPWNWLLVKENDKLEYQNETHFTEEARNHNRRTSEDYKRMLEHRKGESVVSIDFNSAVALRKYLLSFSFCLFAQNKQFLQSHVNDLYLQAICSI